MNRFHKLTGILIALALPVAAEQSVTPKCNKPDSSFTSFLKRFKNDEVFRENRILFPLKVKIGDPAGVAETVVSREKYRLQYGGSRWQIIIGEKKAEELKGGEGQVCEEKPIFQGNAATFYQGSCGNDVYSLTFRFRKEKGCWYLFSHEAHGG
jgi:hypothetical protein